jgi:hypothetical protein
MRHLPGFQPLQNRTPIATWNDHLGAIGSKAEGQLESGSIGIAFARSNSWVDVSML